MMILGVFDYAPLGADAPFGVEDAILWNPNNHDQDCRSRSEHDVNTHLDLVGERYEYITCHEGSVREGLADGWLEIEEVIEFMDDPERVCVLPNNHSCGDHYSASELANMSASERAETLGGF